jgi:ubiquinone/menaquinone biosynthesis C-methylase UbiE
VYEIVVREADLRGRRVLDVGCGTGRLARALTERDAAKVWGVDASEAMLAAAQVPRGVRLKHGRAEALPFRDGWFERVVFWLSVHLVDRSAAFAEARRVLGPGGRIAVVSFDESHFAKHWLTRFFPSLERIDRARFPTGEQLVLELPGARLIRLSQTVRFTRAQALERIRAGHISTFDLLDPDEVDEGIEQAERELPGEIVTPVEWLVAVASTI